MKKSFYMVLVAVATIVLSSCGGKQDIEVNNSINSIIDGFIIDDESKEAVADAKVTISNKTTKTDETGYFKISGLNPGGYPVFVEKEGYLTEFFSEIHSEYPVKYFGDALQAGYKFLLYPTNKTLKLTLVYEYEDNNGETAYKNVPKDISVKLSYEDKDFDKIGTFTTNDNGEITVSNIAAKNSLRLNAYFKYDRTEYKGSTILSTTLLERNDYTLIVRINRYDEIDDVPYDESI